MALDVQNLPTGLGSDVQRPLATVIVWGLFSATIMTVLLIPVLYRLFNPPIKQPVSEEQELDEMRVLESRGIAGSFWNAHEIT